MKTLKEYLRESENDILHMETPMILESLIDAWSDAMIAELWKNKKQKHIDYNINKSIEQFIKEMIKGVD